MVTAMALADYSGVDYFEETSLSIQIVQQLTSNAVQLNLFQCQYLFSKLAETWSFLKAKSDSLRAILDRNDIRRKALLMLHFTAKRAEKLVRNCCCEMESWLESAVTLAQIKEDIVDILLDLRWWTSMLEIAIASVTWMSRGQGIELELLKFAEEDFEGLLKQLQLPSNELDKAATKDKDHLLMRLHDVLASHGGIDRDVQQNHEYLLAAHVRSRLENKVFETMGDADLNVYEVSRIIGLGGFGAVMDVRWLGRRCALKLLKGKCRTEATSLGAFQHPNIVQFFRYWEAPYGVTPSKTPYSTPRDDTPYHTPFSTAHHGTPNDATRSETSMSSHSLKELQSHILMELLPMDLAQHMKASINANAMKVRAGFKRRSELNQELSISEEVGIDVMLQLAKAMWYLNSKDVAHRDLKPSNVLVRPVGEDEVPELSARGFLRVKLADFGLSKTRAHSQASSTQTVNVGTKIYGAPEVFTTEVFSEKKFPRKADVWSFGIMFNEVLSGKPPFEPTDGHLNISELHGRIRNGWRPALPENYPDYLKFCITSCLALRPQNRPNFSDLWRMVRFAQVRSLGLIRENHDLFTFRTGDSVNSLHPLKKTPAPAFTPLLDNKGSLKSKSNSIWLLMWRITYLLVRRRKRSNQASHNVLWESSGAGPSSHRSENKPLGYLVNPVWPLESTSDSKLDVIFFEGNVGRRQYLSCKDTWVQRDKPDVWWPQAWLQKDFKGDIRVLLLEYDISEAGVEGVVDELQRLLVFCDRWNRGHTWKRPVVLVGHSLGCVVIEQLVVVLDKRAKAMESLKDEMEIARAKVSRAFLGSLVGCFFYAPLLKGPLVPSEDILKHVFGGLSYSGALFADLFLDSTKLKEVSEEFMKARCEQVKLMALIEGFDTRGSTVVSPSSIEGFAGDVVELPDSNHSDACKPTDKEHRAYFELVAFIRDVLYLRKDFDEPLPTSVSQMSPSEGFHSRSTIKEYQGYQNVVRLLGTVLNVRKVVSGPGHFYRNQCRVLKEQISLAKEILIKGRASKGVSSGDPLWSKLALTELHRVVKLGKNLIKGCHYDKRCLKAYLRQGERTQAFAEVLKEIVWCKSVVTFYHDSIERYLSWNPSIAMDEFPQARLGDEEQHLLQNAADNDQNELQASLNSWIQNHIQSHSCSAKECGRPFSHHQADDPLMCIAAQILARVSNSEGDITADVKGDHTTILWKTSQILEDGREIGSGSSATVTETTWLGDKYAKKEFDMVPKDFVDEANALAKLNHPHIVKVSAYSVGTHTCFFLMDIMPGNLRKYMNKRMIRLRISQPFSMSAAIDLMLQISDAMSYMNSKEMVHRDLKPWNILVEPVDDPELCKEGFVTAKLADFGLAKSKHEITSHSHFTRENLGTSKWRAPEMFKEAKPSTEKALPWKADVYSFGIVCSEILTGSLPFHHVIFQMPKLHSLLTDPVNPLRPKLPENCPESLASLIRQCWQTEPVDRPTFEDISRRLRYLKGLFMMTATIQ